METIYLSKPPVKASASEECVLAFGFFDGVHFGHKGILEKARLIAAGKNCAFGVMTFYPHPSDILFPERKPMTYLTPLSVKIKRFEQLGVDKLFVIEFNPELARLSPEDFVEQYIKSLRCIHAVAGFDYHYGFKGEGSMKTLPIHGAGSFEVTSVEKIEREGTKISSTEIRRLLDAGKAEAIPDYLGDYFEVEGVVTQCSRLADHEQFASVAPDPDYRLPNKGVYQIKVQIGIRTYLGICHQITNQVNRSSLLLQVKNCPEDIRSKRLKLNG
ncbi:cytidyltransferase [Metabacillus sp. KIGAM252]|uniref:Riboflavin biosynthesis protein n=1 Tax=Metabacillus flavus TaxID=2823519 RepID=A0ABS5LCU1_9BACI|nr:cytidyltransferase [Metabacillus flavus]MBS2968451.1 cytidyltransferase [Metabacillus flavus]